MLNGKDRSDVQRRRNWNAAIEPTDDRRPIVTPYREQTSGLEIIRKLPQIGGGDANNVEPRQGRESDLEGGRSEEHTSELQSLMRISYAVFCLTKKKHKHKS